MMSFPSPSATGYIALVLCLICLQGPVNGGHPTPECRSVPDLIPITPDGSLPFTITLNTPDQSGGCNGGPIVGAIVIVEFSPEADALIAWAPGQDHPILQGTSDANGEVTFYIAGSGCLGPFRQFIFPTFITRVWADEVLLAEPFVNSPDAVNSQGLLPTDLGTNICENGTSAIGLSDAVFFTRPIKLGLIEPCAKFTGLSRGVPVNLGDAVIITSFVKNGGSFVCQQ